MLSSLLVAALAVMGVAHAELSPAEDEPGFRIYDIIKPLGPGAGSGSGDGASDGSGDGASATARSRRRPSAAAPSGPLLYGKLLVVGKDDLVVGTSKWAAGSNYWFWSPDPMRTGTDPCAGTAREELEGPDNPPDFALVLSMDGTLPEVAARSAAVTTSTLPGTSCLPEHAGRGPSRTFGANSVRALAERLVTPGGQLYRMSVVRGSESWDVGYGYHAPGAKSFSDASRFGWLLEVEGDLEDGAPLPKLAGRGDVPSRTIYRIVSDHPKGIVDLRKGEQLVFRRLDERPESARGVSTIDLLVNEL